MSGAFMVRSSGNDTVRTLAAAGSARSTDTYQRYAAGLYRQALLTRGDSALAEHVVRDVIADEHAPTPVPGVAETKHDTGYVRASSVPGSCPRDMAALLRAALLTLATSSKNRRK
jgi:hypothetical protein